MGARARARKRCFRSRVILFRPYGDCFRARECEKKRGRFFFLKFSENRPPKLVHEMVLRVLVETRRLVLENG